MSQIIINENGITSLGSIDKEEDIKAKPGININPPPQNGECECCGRHISELKPFGGPGEPLVGDFAGEYLVKMYRSFCGCIGSSWECRDCAVQDTDEYDEKLKQRYRSLTILSS